MTARNANENFGLGQPNKGGDDHTEEEADDDFFATRSCSDTHENSDDLTAATRDSVNTLPDPESLMDEVDQQEEEVLRDGEVVPITLEKELNVLDLNLDSNRGKVYNFIQIKN